MVQGALDYAQRCAQSAAGPATAAPSPGHQGHAYGHDHGGGRNGNQGDQGGD
jgi:hypothetical protein